MDRGRPSREGTASRNRAGARLGGVLLAAAAIAIAMPASHAATRTPARAAHASDDFLRGMFYPPPLFRPKEFAFLYDAGVFHLFYMRRDKYAADELTEKEFGHATSTDLVHWTELAPILHVQPTWWDSSHVWAPTILKRDDTWYLFYAGVGNVPYAWPWQQRIGVATSTDLMQWTHYDEPVFTSHQIPWTLADSTQFDGSQLRDPFVMEEPDSAGQWLMVYVTIPDSARGQLIVGMARSDGGFSPWQDWGPMWSTDAAHFWGWEESPHVFAHDGLYYLFASTTSGHPISFRTSPVLSPDSTNWDTKYRLWDYAGRDGRNSDSWFASEFLRVGGIDYFAYVDTDSNSIGIEQMQWDSLPPGFALVPPTIPGPLGVPPGERAAALALRLVGRASRAAGALLAVSLAEAADVRLELYDVAGRRLRTLRPGRLGAGETIVAWDGRDGDGAIVPSAMYFARVVTARGRRTLRVPLL
jgi:hypothetical protein